MKMKSFTLITVFFYQGFMNANGGLLDSLVGVGNNRFPPLIRANINFNARPKSNINLPQNHFTAGNDMNPSLNVNTYNNNNNEFKPNPQVSNINNINLNTDIKQNRYSEESSRKTSDVGNVNIVPNKDESFPATEDRFNAEEDDNYNVNNNSEPDNESGNNDNSSKDHLSIQSELNDVNIPTGKSLIDYQQIVGTGNSPLKGLSSIQKLVKDGKNLNAPTIPQLIYPNLNIPQMNQNSGKIEASSPKDKGNVVSSMKDKEVKKDGWVMLKKKKFFFQMQPVRPESEVVMKDEIIYYLDGNA